MMWLTVTAADLPVTTRMSLQGWLRSLDLQDGIFLRLCKWLFPEQNPKCPVGYLNWSLGWIKRVSKPKTRAILAYMRLNFPSLNAPLGILSPKTSKT